MSRISVDVSSARIPVLQVGYQGENEVTDVLFDISSWITEFGEGVAQLRVKRPGNSEDESYVLSLSITDGIAVWTVSETDTFNKGNGKVQLSYMVGNIVKKAVIYPYKVGKSIVGADNPVDPFDSWIERSKAWAIGKTLDGDAVPETDETYQNNAKYYAEQADILGSAQVVLATEQATLATEKATLATVKADAAAESETNAAASEAAVNGVSTQLTNRMTAIETEQSVQSARMDTFTSLPEGSTSGNAELADIRVGANGTTYDTAGNAVRGQIGELKSDLGSGISELANGNAPIFVISNSWQNGNLSNGTVSHDYNNRVVNDNIFRFGFDTKIKAKTGYMFNLNLFNSDDSYYTQRNNLTEYDISGSIGFKIEIRRATENPVSQYESITEFTEAIIFKTPFKIDIESVKKYVDEGGLTAQGKQNAKDVLKYSDELGNYMDSSFAFNQLDWDAGYIDYTGTNVVASDTYQHSDYLPVYGGQEMIADYVAGADRRPIHYYDSDKNHIGAVYTTTGVIRNLKFKPPIDTAYIRINCYNYYNVTCAYINPVKHDYRTTSLVNGWYSTAHNKIENLFATATKKPICTIIDDDTLSVEAITRFRNACNTNGIKGTFACLTMFFSVSNLKETLLAYEREGHQTILHGYSQADIYQDSTNHAAECEDNVVHGLQDLNNAGFTNYKFWATPYGVNTDVLKTIARRWGINSYCTTQIGFENTDATHGRYGLNRTHLDPNDTSPNISLAETKEQARLCAEQNGWLLICTHFSGWGDDISRFTEFCDYAKSLGFEFMTYGEAWNIRKPIYELYESF